MFNRFETITDGVVTGEYSANRDQIYKNIRIKKWVEIKKLHNIQFNGDKGKFPMKVLGYVKQPKSQ